MRYGRNTSIKSCFTFPTTAARDGPEKLLIRSLNTLFLPQEQDSAILVGDTCTSG